MGDALESPFFNEYIVPAEISLSQLLRTAPSRRDSLRKRIKRMAESSDAEMAVSIYHNSWKEVKSGTMSGAYSEKELNEKFGRFWNLVPAFGLHQGEDDQGRPKFRRIDDHSAS